MTKVTIFDSTLRDGAQGEGISFTNHDKIQIIKKLDALGVDYIEAGNPASNPRDEELFSLLQETKLEHSKIVAFGSTRRKDCTSDYDPAIQALINTPCDSVCIFGKASLSQAEKIIGVSGEENLSLIFDSITVLKKHKSEVFFDAEHFFDGFKENREYTLSCLFEAKRAGADGIILCDTKGGTFPDEIFEITQTVKEQLDMPIGIHCHDDAGCAVANAIMAVKAGAVQVQGTFIGFGERCGNTNLSAVIPSLQLKMGYDCIPEERMKLLTKTARYIAETANLNLAPSMPYVGKSAFSHKAGMHADGVSKESDSFEHIDPALVGNNRNILISEMAGRAAMLSVLKTIDDSLTKDSKEAAELIDTLKTLEYEGYVFESAAASLELLVRKQLHRFIPYFKLLRFKVIGEQQPGGKTGLSSAMIKIKVGEFTEITAAEGDGPVHALDTALKKAVERFYPVVSELRLIDYKVRVLEPKAATAASVRVLITTTDGNETWSTIGVSKDIIEASINALLDAIEYKLMQENL